MKKLRIREVLLTLAVAIVIVLTFSFFDYLAHSLNIEYSVPPRYFPHKILYGSIIGFIALLIFRKKKPLIKSLIFSAAISILLQIRYYLEGYPKNFVFLFLGIHFVILLATSFCLFKFLEKKKIKFH
jgi:hypothetical protein